MSYLNKFLFTFIITLNIILANTLSLSDNGDGTWDVNYTSSDAIGGFQFTVDGATVNSASGGDATANGFLVQGSSTTVIGFSLTGSTIPSGEGVLVTVEFNGNPEEICFDGVVVSDVTGQALDTDVSDCWDGSDDSGGDDGGDGGDGVDGGDDGGDGLLL